MPRESDDTSTEIDNAFETLLAQCADLVWNPPVAQKPSMTRFIAAAWVLRQCPADVKELLSNNDHHRFPDALRAPLRKLRSDEGLCNDFKQRRTDFRNLLNRVLRERGLGGLPEDWYQQPYFGLKGALAGAPKTQSPVPDLNGGWLYICNTDGPGDKAGTAYGGFFEMQQDPGSREWTLSGHRTWNGTEKFDEGQYKPWDTHWGRLFNTGGREVIRYAYKIKFKDLHIEGYGISTRIEMDGAGKVQRANGEFWHHPQVDPRWGTFGFRRRAPGESVYWETKSSEAK